MPTPSWQKAGIRQQQRTYRCKVIGPCAGKLPEGLSGGFRKGLRLGSRCFQNLFPYTWRKCIPALANTIPNCNADGSIAGFSAPSPTSRRLEEAKKESEHLTRALMAIRQVNRLITKEKNIDRMVQGSATPDIHQGIRLGMDIPVRRFHRGLLQNRLRRGSPGIDRCTPQ